MKQDLQKIIKQFVDYLMPDLTPYEANLYIFLLRSSYLNNNNFSLRIGKRTIADKIGKSARSDEQISYKQVTKTLKGLEDKGVIKIGNTERDGTLYTVLFPEEIPSVKEKLAIKTTPEEEDYFTSPEKRREIFERDKYICFYCGEQVNENNATLDHLIPQFKGGKHAKDNLKTSCLTCNSIKSGKTYEEAAPLLLKNIKDRTARIAIK